MFQSGFEANLTSSIIKLRSFNKIDKLSNVDLLSLFAWIGENRSDSIFASTKRRLNATRSLFYGFFVHRLTIGTLKLRQHPFYNQSERARKRERLKGASISKKCCRNHYPFSAHPKIGFRLFRSTAHVSVKYFIDFNRMKLCGVGAFRRRRKKKFSSSG